MARYPALRRSGKPLAGRSTIGNRLACRLVAGANVHPRRGVPGKVPA